MILFCRFGYVLPLLSVSVFHHARTSWPQESILTPEKFDFVKTSSYGDIIRFLDVIKSKSSLIKLYRLANVPKELTYLEKQGINNKSVNYPVFKYIQKK